MVRLLPVTVTNTAVHSLKDSGGPDNSLAINPLDYVNLISLEEIVVTERLIEKRRQPLEIQCQARLKLPFSSVLTPSPQPPLTLSPSRQQQGTLSPPLKKELDNILSENFGFLPCCKSSNDFGLRLTLPSLLLIQICSAHKTLQTAAAICFATIVAVSDGLRAAVRPPAFSCLLRP